MSGSSSTPTDGRRVPLRGMERMVIAVDGVSMKIVHSMLVSGGTGTLMRFLPSALVSTFNRHPRMRVMQVKGEPFMGEVQPPVTLETVSAQGLLRIRRFESGEDDEEGFDEWGKFSESECNIGFDRYSQLPFYLTVWVDEKRSSARMMLFSDHYMSDGYSGMVVLNDILQHVALCSRKASESTDGPPQVETAEKELPLRPSLYKMWLSRLAWAKPIVKAMIALFDREILRDAAGDFKPLFPARDDQHDFTVPPVTNSTSALFADGDEACMQRALQKCKSEGVSFGGAFTAAVVLAFYRVLRAEGGVHQGEVFKFSGDLDYNMRKRVPKPAEEDQVGMYPMYGELEWLAKEGVNMETTLFWDLARRSKREIDRMAGNTLIMALPTFMMDRRLNSQMKPKLLKGVTIRNSLTSDANISSIGRYPYQKTYQLVEQDKDGKASTNVLTVESLHVYNPLPHLGSSTVIFVASVHTFNYSLGHKMEPRLGEDIFRNLVEICEGIGDIDSKDKLTDVLGRVKP